MYCTYGSIPYPIISPKNLHNPICSKTVPRFNCAWLQHGTFIENSQSMYIIILCFWYDYVHQYTGSLTFGQALASWHMLFPQAGQQKKKWSTPENTFYFHPLKCQLLWAHSSDFLELSISRKKKMGLVWCCRKSTGSKQFENLPFYDAVFVATDVSCMLWHIHCHAWK